MDENELTDGVFRSDFQKMLQSGAKFDFAKFDAGHLGGLHECFKEQEPVNAVSAILALHVSHHWTSSRCVAFDGFLLLVVWTPALS